ncbi:acyltransferase [Legionella qingyii]|uniref:Acyltransferase n=1 Tax=Legionella qingyii TaxID=2184757 RepID=A0A317TZB2_9GAMM|nr:acyltransferase [Legionella qingyii]PWY54891.1 acyltransferase [Legionella qingyii]RUR20905.1 acyltransferase [Legionella qingyii]RUR23246.1 acyltransferase [Legionella qingyii]
MNSFLRLVCCTIILLLGGCHGLQQNALKGQTLEQCNRTCVQHFDFCRQNCVNNCSTCSHASQREAEKNFAKYVHERKVEGKKVMRELNSYRDPLQCRKVTCDCLSDFTICKKGCTGVIPKKLQAVPY